MVRFTKQIATAVALLFSALLMTCPLFACTSAQPAEASKHSCCPKSKKHDTQSHADCPLLRPEFRVGIVKDKVRTVTVGAIYFAVSVPTLPVPEAGATVPVETFAPDRGELHILNRVLRI